MTVSANKGRHASTTKASHWHVRCSLQERIWGAEQSRSSTLWPMSWAHGELHADIVPLPTSLRTAVRSTSCPSSRKWLTFSGNIGACAFARQDVHAIVGSMLEELSRLCIEIEHFRDPNRIDIQRFSIANVPKRIARCFHAGSVSPFKQTCTQSLKSLSCGVEPSPHHRSSPRLAAALRTPNAVSFLHGRGFTTLFIELHCVFLHFVIAPGHNTLHAGAAAIWLFRRPDRTYWNQTHRPAERKPQLVAGRRRWHHQRQDTLFGAFAPPATGAHHVTSNWHSAVGWPMSGNSHVPVASFTIADIVSSLFSRPRVISLVVRRHVLPPRKWLRPSSLLTSCSGRGIAASSASTRQVRVLCSLSEDA